MSTSWRHYSPDNFRTQSTRKQNYTSAPISSTPVSSTSAAQISSNASLQHLCADVKAILQSVEASLQEQKKISKDLNDLGTTVNFLEGVLCGNVGSKKRAENMDLDTVQSERGIVRRLATMDGAINDLLARVSRLDTASRAFSETCFEFAFSDEPSTFPLLNTSPCSVLQRKRYRTYAISSTSKRCDFYHWMMMRANASGFRILGHIDGYR
jgi:hypothetical protein